MKIIDDNVDFIKSLERYFKYVNIGGKDFNRENLTFINVSFISKKSDKRLDRKGLDEAIKEDFSNKVMLYSFESVQSLFSNKKFMKVMSQPNVYFMRLPDIKSEFVAELSEPKFYHQAMELVADSKISKNVAGAILHRVSTDQEYAKRGREELGFFGTDEQIITMLEDARNQTGIDYDGVIAGLFVDVEGTLYSNGQINDELVNKIIAYGKKGSVSIWSGEDTDKIRKIIGPKFTGACIAKGSRIYTRTPILSKHEFRGCKVEHVIDNLTQETFENLYSIKANKYDVHLTK